MRREQPRESVHALARGLDVLEAFSADRLTMTLSQVAMATSLSPATARRCLITLEWLGYIRQTGRQFELTPRVLSLGAAYFGSMDLTGVAQKVLRDLADTLQRACSVTVLDANEVVYIAHVTPARPPLARHYVGARLPAHATSTGHVLLAHLPGPDLAAFLSQAPFAGYTTNTPTSRAELEAILGMVRAHGYAVVSDTVEYGAAAVAVPVRNPDGAVIAALNSSASAISEHERKNLLDRLDALTDAASRFEQAVGRFPAVARST